MRVLLGMAGSFSLFWAGHAISRAVLRYDCLAFLYPLYNRLLLWSSNIEEWAGIDFYWKSPE